MHSYLSFKFQIRSKNKAEFCSLESCRIRFYYCVTVNGREEYQFQICI